MLLGDLTPEELVFLIHLAGKGCARRWFKTSTTRIASELGVSQQTISRRLRSLATKGYVERVFVKGGEAVRLTRKAVVKLMEVHNVLSRAFEESERTLSLEGMVVSGLGEGRYYVSLEGYRRQIEERLGFSPYPGTLNVKLMTASDVLLRRRMEAYPGIWLRGFSNGLRTYGDVKCFRAEVEGLRPAAVVLPVRTSHPEDIIELIAPFPIRERLGLRDGDVIRFKVFLE